VASSSLPACERCHHNTRPMHDNGLPINFLSVWLRAVAVWHVSSDRTGAYLDDHLYDNEGFVLSTGAVNLVDRPPSSRG
jgi:hypothetical protein